MNLGNMHQMADRDPGFNEFEYKADNTLPTPVNRKMSKAQIVELGRQAGRRAREIINGKLDPVTGDVIERGFKQIVYEIENSANPEAVDRTLPN